MKNAEQPTNYYFTSTPQMKKTVQTVKVKDISLVIFVQNIRTYVSTLLTSTFMIPRLTPLKLFIALKPPQALFLMINSIRNFNQKSNLRQSSLLLSIWPNELM